MVWQLGINSVNFNATTLKLAEKFDHPFSHLFIFGNKFAQGHGFVGFVNVETYIYDTMQTFYLSFPISNK